MWRAKVPVWAPWIGHFVDVSLGGAVTTLAEIVGQERVNHKGPLFQH